MTLCLRTAQIGAFCIAALAAGAAEAEQSQPDPVLRIELNTATDVEGACRLSFLAENGLSVDLDALVLETVVFTTERQVDRLTLFDFQTVPAGRPRVRQFDLAGVTCAGMGSLLINGVEACSGDGIEPTDCQGALQLESRTEIEVQG